MKECFSFIAFSFQFFVPISIHQIYKVLAERNRSLFSFTSFSNGLYSSEYVQIEVLTEVELLMLRCMYMEKYQKKFIEKINETMKSWRDKNTVSKEELYRFLHSIKGTAATIGLEQLSHEADGKLKDISVIHHQQLEVDRVEHLLKDLLRSTIQLSTQGPSLNAVIQKEDTQREEKLILLVDDDLSTIHIIKEKLEHSGYMVLVGLTVEKALPIFYDQNPDCILINMQSKNSIDLLEVIIGNAQSRFVPVISIINGNRKDMGIQVLEEGVTDILYTPINFQELEIRVRNRIKQKELVNNAVLIDELTGAFNRRFLNLELKRYLYELKRTKQALSLAILEDRKSVV